METELERLDAAVPGQVREVCRRLDQAGHQAVTVGGAVRDALIGRAPGDWDVATSATPSAVTQLFARTLPTGLAHGTVTVLIGGGSSGGRHAVEVTTFRGEGAYSDARRPDAVVFGVPLAEDLARRDFVINAIAFDPIRRALHDPFGGRADLAAGIVRAVGDPSARFGEDGLRIMRAVRFVAMLDFTLDLATEAAIPGALVSLARVSRERVRVELAKLLAGPAAGRSLAIAGRTGILDQVVPELRGADLVAARARVESVPAEPVVRTAALLLTASPDAVDRALRRLTYSNADRERAVLLVGEAAALSAGAPDAALRAALGRAGRTRAVDLAALVPACADRLAAIAVSGDPLTIGELALKGPDVMRILCARPGPAIGRALAFLYDRVLADPSLNTPAALERLLRDDFAL